jgi:hypothetical protein
MLINHIDLTIFFKPVKFKLLREKLSNSSCKEYFTDNCDQELENMISLCIPNKLRFFKDLKLILNFRAQNPQFFKSGISMLIS